MAKTEGLYVTDECQRELDQVFKLLRPGHATHAELCKINVPMPTDFEPDGLRDRDRDTPCADCSCGCQFFHTLDGPSGGDWGVCTNPKSPRVGRLTFEHAGCPEYTPDPRWELLEKAQSKIYRKYEKRQRANPQGLMG